MSIESVSTGVAGAVPYCLVKVIVPHANPVLVPEVIHIWVGLPMGDKWNGRWQSLGGGVYAGTAALAVPTSALLGGYAGADERHRTYWRSPAVSAVSELPRRQLRLRIRAVDGRRQYGRRGQLCLRVMTE